MPKRAVNVEEQKRAGNGAPPCSPRVNALDYFARLLYNALGSFAKLSQLEFSNDRHIT